MQRHYLANKGPSSLSYGFSNSHVWMWELGHKESWALKNWCFWTVVFKRRLLRVPWTARRSNQSIPKEISPGCSLKRLMLKLKLQYFGHLMWRADSLEKSSCWESSKARGEGDDRGWDRWTASPTQWTWVWVNSGSWWCTGRPGMLQSMGSQSWTRLSDWTDHPKLAYQNMLCIPSGSEDHFVLFQFQKSTIQISEGEEFLLLLSLIFLLHFCLYMWKTTNSHQYLNSSTTQDLIRFFISICVNPFSSSEKPDFHSL